MSRACTNHHSVFQATQVPVMQQGLAKLTHFIQMTSTERNLGNYAKPLHKQK